MPYNNHLFFTNIIKDFKLINDLICEAKNGLDLNSSLPKPKKVLVYKTKESCIRRYITFWIKGVALRLHLCYSWINPIARFLNVQSRTITNHIDNWIKGGIKGYYLFSKELNIIEKEKLIKISNLRKTNNCEIWVYEANNLKSIYGKFTSMQKAARFLLD